MKNALCALLVVLINLVRIDAQEHRVIPLSEQWEFKQSDDSLWYAAEVPGVVHLDLMNHGFIEDPFYGKNELEYQWIEENDWVYRTNFDATKKDVSSDHLDLVFEGLDTYAKVKLNGMELLEANNMFRTWRIPIKDHAKEGENTLEIYFTSPINQGKDMVASYPYVLPSGNEAESIEHKVYSFTRKAAYHFGWDWGPRFVTSGIWRPVYLEAWDDAKIENAFVQTQSIQNGIASMKVEIELNIQTAGKYQIQIDTVQLSQHFTKGVQTLEYEFDVTNPQLWWCNGMGEPHLYNVDIQLLNDQDVLDTKVVRYGIRTVELVHEKDAIGTAFYFKLNGQALFIKGANYIPQDMFLPKVSDKQYDDLTNSAHDANMNMIRVWGGGIYENDLFYDLCDEKGILVWQDFMFACSLYPEYHEFHENVKYEVIDNIKRLRNHPCIAIWCGNNEVEVAWHNWGWQKTHGYSRKEKKSIWANYKALFHKLIPSILGELDPSRPYTTTSPISNWGTPENFNHSTMHYWGVWHGSEPFEEFKNNVGRFVSEYGFQSFPSIETLLEVIPDTSMYLDSELMTHRQKSYIGNGMILTHVKQYYGTPDSFEEFVLLSQKTQAKGMQMAIESHMSDRSHCMGTLFWQLNDCWPGPSWSVIDYYGRKKEAYFTVKEEYAK